MRYSVPRNPEFDVELSHQPAGETDVIGMHMRDDHALDRAAHHRAREELFPRRGGVFVLDAAVHDGPAVAILQQPQIDVVELHRKAHAHPMDAGRHDDAFARFWPAFEGVVEIASRADPGFGCAHAGAFRE